MKKIKVKFKKRFIKKVVKAPKKIKISLYKKILLFENNPFDKSLNNHALNGEFREFRSINISGDLRAIFKQTETGEIIFVNFYYLDNHNNLYD